ncbi:RraA family protein [Bosea sp. 685]|uniref:RraA family protein n=1 Tax=Bosea sp. 685 TaxID=3080057 RepID=UPI0028934BD9|nr:RraA family protein [Bosea sp. 685]WNJ88865.1 RraA family protein [Bosea sp. 685]
MPVSVQAPQIPQIAQSDLDRWRAVPAAIIADLDRHDALLDPRIRPICAVGRQPRLFGRAVTALCEPPDFGAVLYAVDAVGPGDVLVIAASGHAETAMIGEILGGQLRRKGACGIVCDGAVRDVATLAGWSDFSVFARSITPRGPSSAERGVVNRPVVVGGQLVSPGDLLIGDDDGLVVLSPAAIRRLIGDAEAKLAKEAAWEEALAGGTSVQSLFGLPEAAAPTNIQS